MASSSIPLHSSSRGALRRFLWAGVIVLCLIGAAASIRRMTALNHNDASSARAPQQLAELDRGFARKARLTWVHITSGLIFVTLVPFQFASMIRIRRPNLHRWMGRILVAVGIVAATTAMKMVSNHPIGGV